MHLAKAYPAIALENTESTVVPTAMTNEFNMLLGKLTAAMDSRFFIKWSPGRNDAPEKIS